MPATSRIWRVKLSTSLNTEQFHRLIDVTPLYYEYHVSTRIIASVMETYKYFRMLLEHACMNLSP